MSSNNSQKESLNYSNFNCFDKEGNFQREVLTKLLKLTSPTRAYDPKKHLDLPKWLVMELSSWFGRLGVDVMLILSGKVNYTCLLPGNSTSGTFPRTPQAEEHRIKLRDATSELVSTLKNKESTDQDRTKAQIKYRETHMGYSVLRYLGGGCRLSSESVCLSQTNTSVSPPGSLPAPGGRLHRAYSWACVGLDYWAWVQHIYRAE